MNENKHRITASDVFSSLTIFVQRKTHEWPFSIIILAEKWSEIGYYKISDDCEKEKM